MDSWALKEQNKQLQCVNCLNAFDFHMRTPYKLPCGHTACKQCLKMARQSNQEFFCWDDSEKIPTEQIQFLKKDPNACRVLIDEQKMRARSQKDQIFNNTMSSQWSANNIPREAPQSPLQGSALNGGVSDFGKEEKPARPIESVQVTHMISTIPEVEGEESKNESQIIGASQDYKKRKIKDGFGSESEDYALRQSTPATNVLNEYSDRQVPYSQQRSIDNMVFDTKIPEIKEADDEDDAFVSPSKSPPIKPASSPFEEAPIVLPHRLQSDLPRTSLELDKPRPRQRLSDPLTNVSKEEETKLAEDLAREYVTDQIKMHIENQQEYPEVENRFIDEQPIEEDAGETAAGETAHFVPTERTVTDGKVNESDHREEHKTQPVMLISDSKELPEVNVEDEDNQGTENIQVVEEEKEILPPEPVALEEKKSSYMSLENKEPFEKRVTEYKNLDKQGDDNTNMDLHSVVLQIPQTDRSDRKKQMNANEEPGTPSASYEIASSIAPGSNEEPNTAEKQEEFKYKNQQSNVSAPIPIPDTVEENIGITNKQFSNNLPHIEGANHGKQTPILEMKPPTPESQKIQTPSLGKPPTPSQNNPGTAEAIKDKQQVFAFGLVRTTTQMMHDDPNNSLNKSALSKKKKKGKKKKKRVENDQSPDQSAIVENIDIQEQPEEKEDNMQTIIEQNHESTTPLVKSGNEGNDQSDNQLDTSQSLAGQEIVNEEQIYIKQNSNLAITDSQFAMRKMITKMSGQQLDSENEQDNMEDNHDMGSIQDQEEEKFAGQSQDYDELDALPEEYLDKVKEDYQISPETRWAEPAQNYNQPDLYLAKNQMTQQLSQFEQPPKDLGINHHQKYNKSMPPPLPTKSQGQFKLPEITNNRNKAQDIQQHHLSNSRPPPAKQQRRMITSPLSMGRSSSEEVKLERQSEGRLSRESAGSRYINSKRNSPSNVGEFKYEFQPPEPRPASTRSSNSAANQETRRMQPLNEQCRLHPHESIKYFCREQGCQRGLCPDCVLDHARHDFIAANELAALEIKGAVKTAIRTCRSYAKSIKTIKIDTNKKLSDLHRQRQDEFQKIHCYFLELHRELDEREQQLKVYYNESIRDVEAKLMQDAQAIELEYNKQSITFKKFKSLQDQFQLSSDSGIVGSAEMVFHQTKKLEKLEKTVDLPYLVVKDAGKELPVPSVVMNLDLEKTKIQKIGKIQGLGEFSPEPDVLDEGSQGTFSQQLLSEETKVQNLVEDTQKKKVHNRDAQTTEPWQQKPIIKQVVQERRDTESHAKVSDASQIHWFKWGTTSVFRFDATRKDWIERRDFKVGSKFLFFSSVCHLPYDKGCYIMGGSDNEDNYSKRTQYFCKYQKFVEKPHMISKRAFFPSIYCRLDNSIFVVGGNDSSRDLDKCEKISLSDSTWRQIAPLNTARNGSALIVFEQYRLMFAFGGNNHKLGSLSKIERYDMDYDKWTTIQLTLKTAVHDLGLIQLENERILVYGGHTNTEPCKELHLMDMSVECLKAKSGLMKLKRGGKCYFNPVQGEGSKIMLIFGYLDEKPDFEEIDLQEIGPINESSMILSSKQIESRIITHRSGK